MQKILKIFTAVFVLLFVIAFSGNAAKTQIVIIFDASGSMWGQINGKAKIEIAKNAFGQIVDELAKLENMQVALRVYGHLNKKCSNSVLEVPMGSIQADAVKTKIKSLVPKGKTPIAFSIEMAVDDFNQEIKGEKVILVVTDGMESCGGDPCRVALKLKNAGIVTKIHVVGFGMDKKGLDSLKCIVAPSGGMMLGAADAKGLAKAFGAITKSIVSDNLLILGRDKNNRKVYMDVQVHQGGQVIASSEGADVNFSLKEGIYDVKTTSRSTKMTIWRKHVKVSKSKRREETIVYSESELKIRGIDSADKPIYSWYTIYKAGTSEEVTKSESKGWAKIILNPGEYDVKVFEQDTNPVMTLWVRGIKIGAGEQVTKTVKFASGSIMIKPVISGSSTSKKYWWYYVYPTGETKKRVGQTEGVGNRKIVLAPGSYSISVIDDYNNVVKTVSAIIVEEGKSVDVVIPLGK